MGITLIQLPTGKVEASGGTLTSPFTISGDLTIQKTEAGISLKNKNQGIHVFEAIADEAQNGIEKVIEDSGAEHTITDVDSLYTAAKKIFGVEVSIFHGSNYLSTFVLDGSTLDMSVDGTTPVEYFYTVLAGKKVKLTRGLLTIEDGATEFAPGDFGQIPGALANGLEVSITPFGESKVVLETWTTNRELRNTMFDFDNEFKQAGSYVGRWTFGRDVGDSGILLNVGDKFSITVQDNLSSLDHLSFRLKGSIEDI